MEYYQRKFHKGYPPKNCVKHTQHIHWLIIIMWWKCVNSWETCFVMNFTKCLNLFSIFSDDSLILFQIHMKLRCFSPAYAFCYKNQATQTLLRWWCSKWFPYCIILYRYMYIEYDIFVQIYETPIYMSKYLFFNLEKYFQYTVAWTSRRNDLVKLFIYTYSLIYTFDKMNLKDFRCYTISC